MINLNPRLTSDLRGPLFFFQVLPFIFEPNNAYESVVFIAGIFNVVDFLRYFFNICIVEGMTNLYTVAFKYMSPFVILFVFLSMYLMSAKLGLVRPRFHKELILLSLWSMTVFVYHYLAVTSFMLLHCHPVGEKSVFFYDGSVSCFEGEHLPMAVLAFIVLSAFVIPLPIIVLLITTGRWKLGPQIGDTLMDGLRLECLWWWSADLLRRVLLIAAYAFIPDRHSKQVSG